MDIKGLGDPFYSSTDGRFVFKKHVKKKINGSPLSLLAGPITHASADIPAALQNAKAANEICKTIVYDSSLNAYNVYSDSYITMFNNN